MSELIGLAALVVLTAAEGFAFSGAVFWALAEFLHLGKMAEQGAFGLAALLGIGAGFWIYRMAMAHPQK